jgi:TPR repeat protein
VIEMQKYKIKYEDILLKKRREEIIFNINIEDFLSVNDIGGLIGFCTNKIENGWHSGIVKLANILEGKGRIEKMIDILNYGVSKQYVPALVKLTQYYVSVKDLTSVQMLLDHFILAISQGHTKMIVGLENEYIFFIIANYYLKRKEYAKMVPFYLLAIETYYEPAMIEYAHYLKNNDIPKFKKYLKLAVEKKESALAMHELGLFYLEQSKLTQEDEKATYIQFYQNRINDFDSALDYFMMAYEHGFENAHILGDIFRLKGDYVRMEKFYGEAIVYNNEYAMVKLADYFEEIQKDEKQALKYLLMAFERNNMFALRKIKQIYTKNNNISQYIDLVKEQILNGNTTFRSHFSKLTLFLDSRKKYFEKDVCPICYETLILIPFDCFCHLYCVACYERIEKCALCNFDKHIDNKYLLVETTKRRNLRFPHPV